MFFFYAAKEARICELPTTSFSVPDCPDCRLPSS